MYIKLIVIFIAKILDCWVINSIQLLSRSNFVDRILGKLAVKLQAMRLVS